MIIMWTRKDHFIYSIIQKNDLVINSILHFNIPADISISKHYGYHASPYNNIYL